MALPTKILLAVLMVSGMKVYADLTATDEGTAKFQESESTKPASSGATSEQTPKPDMADDASEAGTCAVDCHSASSRSTSLLKHSNFKDLAEVGRFSAKQP
jgi:hypothetical protein